MLKGLFWVLLPTFATGILVSGYFFIHSCNNFLRSPLVEAQVDSITVHGDDGSVLITDEDQLNKMVRSINRCPRQSTAEMSFADPGNQKMILTYPNDLTEEIVYYGEEQMQIIYDGYLIRINWSLLELGMSEKNISY
ncbi:hypothetical protein JCM19046_755 [Bacillus sp. JCM 19046]|nr:hypothetical protein JCM19045_2374 [Bacillus sp. JCM 19045]GAF16327.1 hypothetical protein JCM19046_755 [Bacillus sp. JCM 19046]